MLSGLRAGLLLLWNGASHCTAWICLGTVRAKHASDRIGDMEKSPSLLPFRGAAAHLTFSNTSQKLVGGDLPLSTGVRGHATCV